MWGTIVKSSVAYSFPCRFGIHNASSHCQKHSFVAWVIASVYGLKASHALTNCNLFVGNQSADHSCQSSWLHMRPWMLNGKVHICLNCVVLLVHWDVSAVFHWAEIYFFLALGLFVMYFFTFARMITMESHHLALFQLRNQKNTLVAFLTL